MRSLYFVHAKLKWPEYDFFGNLVVSTVEENRLKQWIFCLFPATWLRLKMVHKFLHMPDIVICSTVTDSQSLACMKSSLILYDLPHTRMERRTLVHSKAQQSTAEGCCCALGEQIKPLI